MNESPSLAPAGNTGAREPSLDGWRGTAIAALLLGHFVGGFGYEPRYGINVSRLGVELFFVLSGLLMGNLLFVRAVAIGHFYRRRVARIFPALYAYLLIITIVLAVAYRTFDGRSIAAVFLLYFNYYAAGAQTTGALQYHHIWSLCIEEHAYILLTLVAVVSRRHRIKDHVLIAAVVIASWMFVAAYTTFTDWDYYRLYWRTEARLGAVFCSAWLVCWLRDGHRPLVRGGAVLVPLLAGLGLQAEVVPDAIKYTVGTLLLAVAVTHLRFASEWLLRCYRQKWLTRAGVLSYSIYLWQQPFMVLRRQIRGPIVLTGAIMAGVLSFYLLEEPSRRWLNARWTGGPRRDAVERTVVANQGASFPFETFSAEPPAPAPAPASKDRT
jgi:peptidoglycan/LPS O-acetylase OafA/YrhL